MPLPLLLGLEEGGGGAAAIVFGLEKRGEVLLLPYLVDAVTVVVSGGLRHQNKEGGDTGLPHLLSCFVLPSLFSYSFPTLVCTVNIH